MTAKRRIRVRLSRTLFRRVAAKAIEEGSDVNQVIVRAVEADNPIRGRRGKGGVAIQRSAS
jgi:hypothetical protein